MKFRLIIKNFFSGIFSQFITICLGIIIPKLFIVNLGSETNGLMSSINQFLVYLSLLEAGVGTATIQALYGPIANDDKKTINGIMSATNMYYKKTGIIYLLLVLIFSIVYPLFMDTSLDYFTILLVIFLSGLSQVITYLFHGKYKLLLNADGKTYVVNNLATIITLLTSITKIILLLMGFDIIAIQFSYIIINVLQMLFLSYYIKKIYPWINVNVTPNLQAISKKSSVMIHQISYLVFSNTDIIILSMFCNLEIVSVYTIYNTIFSSLSSLLNSINNSVIFYLGETYHKSINKFRKIIDIYENIYMTLNYICYNLALIFIIPFMRIYTFGIKDVNYIDYTLAVLFTIINILIATRTAMSNTINVSGYFKETEKRAVLEMLINLVVSFILVKIIGIYGVLLGTIFALLYRANDIILFTNRKILNRSAIKTYKNILRNTVIFFILIHIFNFNTINFISYYKLILSFIKCAIIVILIYIIGLVIFNPKDFKIILKYVKNRYDFYKINKEKNNISIK